MRFVSAAQPVRCLQHHARFEFARAGAVWALLRHPQAQVGWLPTDDDCLLAYMRRISRRAAFQRTFAKAPAFLEAAAKL